MADTIATIANAVTSATGTAPSAGSGVPTTAAANKASLAGNFDTFLRILTTQLKNQNPLDPLDTNQFTQQLVQFAGVEQQINMNSNLTSLIGLSQQNIVSSAVNYIGKTIEGESSQVPLQGGWFPHAFIGTMSNLQRFAAGEDDTLVTSVEDAWHTMALVEACFTSSAAPATPVPSHPKA